MITLTRKTSYKGGGASYAITGVRGSVYINGVIDGAYPETIAIDLGDATLRTSNASEHKAGVAERKAKREAVAADKAQAKADKKAAAQLKKDDADLARVQKKAEKAAAKAAAKTATA